MEPITWTVVASLLIKYGPEVADFIIRKVESRGVVTVAEWEELRHLSIKTPRSQLLDALARAGVPESDDKAKALIALLPPQ